jgi:hypothetical protein
MNCNIASSRDEAERRWAICKACPVYMPALSRCAHCGCLLRLKVWAASATCPEKRW